MENSGRYEVSMKESSHMIVSEITTVQSAYARQESVDGEWENPFRPDGVLSKEADEIVELIKEGKPITPTLGGGFGQLSTATDGQGSSSGAVKEAAAVQENVKKPLGACASPGEAFDSKINGSLVADGNAPITEVEVQATTTPAPGDPSQVEHVLLKKKPKCKCCVIQ